MSSASVAEPAIVSAHAAQTAETNVRIVVVLSSLSCGYVAAKRAWCQSFNQTRGYGLPPLRGCDLVAHMNFNFGKSCESTTPTGSRLALTTIKSWMLRS